MSPKEKAQELFNKYFAVAESIEWSSEETALKAEKLNDELGDDVLIYWNELAKQSALIAVDEMLSNDGWSGSMEEWHIFKIYFEEVKHKITQL
jgi:hypothetical protein